tara:strand:- start:44 stop:211 length:168 start_codon:yes stop_codon:yes gene_type:complete
VKKWKVVIQGEFEFEVEAKIQPEAVMRCVRGFVQGKSTGSKWTLIKSEELKENEG